MRVSGFTIIRDGIRFGYPFSQSIRSLLPLVDELVVAVGDSSDDTLAQVEAIDSPKLVILQTKWDPALCRGGQVMAQQTNLALARCTGDWCFYLQGDEVLHEKDYPRVKDALRHYLPQTSIEGLSFRYKHFWGDYTIRNPLPYRKQIRIVRNGIGIQSVKDACGFGRAGHRLRQRATGAWVYHYGWVRPPHVMRAKMQQFCQFYNGGNAPPMTQKEIDWHYDLAACVPYHGTHPQVMQDVIAAKDWPDVEFQPHPLWHNSAWWRGRLKKAWPWLHQQIEQRNQAS